MHLLEVLRQHELGDFLPDLFDKVFPPSQSLSVPRSTQIRLAASFTVSPSARLAANDQFRPMFLFVARKFNVRQRLAIEFRG